MIPLGGKGSRFKLTHTFPKPLIELTSPIDGSTISMIEMVIKNLNLKAKYIFLVSKELYENYAIKELLEIITKPNECEIIVEEPPIYGAAYACLLAKHLICNDDNLIIVNCDQFFDTDLEQFLNFVHKNKCDGACITINSHHPKWSFCAVNEDGVITEVAEKKPISNHANTGLYYFNKGSDFVSAVKQMIKNKETVNGEYYVAPSFNYMIKNDAKILNYPIPASSFLPTGTPEDLEKFERIMRERKDV